MSLLDHRYRLFSWEHSYFSGKVRAYLRYKQYAGALAFEDILATQELIMNLLLPATQTGAVPQMLAPDGTWVQDSSEIIDYCEQAHPEAPIVPDATTSPRQRLVAYLIELLADEWMLVYAFWERWLYSLDDADPSQTAFNEQQWGAFLSPDAKGMERRQAGRFLFENLFGIKEAKTNPQGVYRGLVDLGVSDATGPAWKANNDRILDALEAHFAVHDFIFGGLPSLADFGLMAPLYAHLFRDAVSGFDLRTRYPLVSEWVERTNGTNALNARTYGQSLYSIGEGGDLVARPATSDGGMWLPEDEIPPTLMPLLEIFFDDMWPVLVSSCERLRTFLDSDAHQRGTEVPGKSFFASPGFEALQQEGGPLTHAFNIEGVTSRRMVIPYQVWMLQRLADVVRECRSRTAVEPFLGSFASGRELLELDSLLKGCGLEKRGGCLFSVAEKRP